MTVHLFEAVPSLACSNYALRKTANVNVQHFFFDVINTITRNVYVDDSLKSLPLVKDASTHVCSLKPANFKDIVSSQLHHFSDAPETGFGSVSYIRLEDSHDRIYCTILQGKSHLVPIKKIPTLCPARGTKFLLSARFPKFYVGKFQHKPSVCGLCKTWEPH